MNTLHTPETPSLALPEVHFIVPPPGHEATLESILANATPDSVLGWRVAANTAQVLSDDALTPAMAHALQQGHSVIVWHGFESWSPQDLSLRLGRDSFRHLSARLSWAQLDVPASPTNSKDWADLTRQLQTPDDADLRHYIQSDGQHLPRWSMSEALNQQGLEAFQAWVALNLTPSIEAWDTDPQSDPAISELDPSDEVTQDPDLAVQWPWHGSLTWVAQGWLSQVQANRINPSDGPANQAAFTLRAAPLRVGRAEQESYQAILHPVNAAHPWQDESLMLDPQDPATPPGTANTAKVTLRRPAQDPHAPYTVEVSLPGNFGARQPLNGWCLWLHLSDGLPLALPFRHSAHSDPIQPEWPKPSPSAPDHLPSEALWRSIRDGSVSLDML